MNKMEKKEYILTRTGLGLKEYLSFLDSCRDLLSANTNEIISLRDAVFKIAFALYYTNIFEDQGLFLLGYDTLYDFDMNIVKKFDEKIVLDKNMKNSILHFLLTYQIIIMKREVNIIFMMKISN
jgi:D-lyxose ketol-isomerase